MGHLRSTLPPRYLACRDLNWSVPDPRLYNEAFTGRDRAIPHAHIYCFDDDHNGSKTPTAPCWGMSQPWVPGQCLHLARLVAALMKGDVSAASTSTFVHPAVDLTQSSNVSNSNRQAAACAGTLSHILATQPLTSKSSNNCSDLRQSLIPLLTMIRYIIRTQNAALL